MAGSAPRWPALLSLAVHELRSPATVVSGYVKMLLHGHGGSLTDVQRDALDQVQRSCDRMVELLAVTSDLARLEGGRADLASDRMDLGDLLNEAAAAVVAASRLGFRLAVTVPRHPCVVTADRVRLARAVAALATLVARAEDAETVYAAGERVGGDAVITVSTDSRPVSPAVLRQLGPLDDLTGGLGLAIPLARFVVESAGGRLAALASLASTAHGAVIVLPVTRPGPQA